MASDLNGHADEEHGASTGLGCRAVFVGSTPLCRSVRPHALDAYNYDVGLGALAECLHTESERQSGDKGTATRKPKGRMMPGTGGGEGGK